MGLGSTLALLLVALGSAVVGIIFALLGTGTLGMTRRPT
jgi:putative spermidine/putrescine transport system permease protein